MMKKLLILGIILCLSLSFMFFKVDGMTAVPYATYTENAQGELILTQDAYIPVASIEHADFSALKELQLFQSSIYVLSQSVTALGQAPTENQLVIFDLNFQYLHTLSLPSIVKKPEGFYVTESNLFIADSGVDDLGYVHIFSYNPLTYAIVYEQSIGKPETPLFGESTPFIPKKIAVDPRGNLYIISEGALNGVLQMSDSGRFFGFFGANKSDSSRLRNVFNSIIPLNRQIVLPPTPTNLAIDHEGFIYTVTEGLAKTGLKKFNVASRNFLPSQLNVIQGNIDVTTGNFNNIYTLSNNGIIREYDIEGNMLFSFGGSQLGDTRLGLFQKPVSIIVTPDNKLLVADEQAKNIQIFDYTEFASYVHLAIQNYQDVNFEEGIRLWNDVLLYNGWFDLAYKGIGNAHLSQGNYREAMTSYRRTNDIEGYSNAFWELRNVYIETYVGLLVVLFFGVQGLYLVKRSYNQKGHFILPKSWHEKADRVKQTESYRMIVQPFKIIRHPLDSFYDIKRKNHTSVLVSTIIYLMIAVVYFIQLFVTNYIFIGEIEQESVIVNLLLIYAGLFIFIVMNYLVCSIREGSGFFKEVYIGVSHAIVPIMIITILMSFLSRVLTLNEIFIYQYVYQIGYVWTAILIYFLVKDIHYYDVGETFMNIGVTVFSMIVLAFVFFMGYVIFNQSFTFFEEVIREAILRVQGS